MRAHTPDNKLLATRELNVCNHLRRAVRLLESSERGLLHPTKHTDIERRRSHASNARILLAILQVFEQSRAEFVESRGLD